MGAMQNNQQDAKKGKNRRGTVRNSDRLAAFANGQANGGADWGGCDEQVMQAVVLRITELGGAVTFGLSRDLGAHSLCLMLDESRKTLWFNGDADLTEELRQVVGTLNAMT